MSWPASSVEKERWNWRASLESSTDAFRGRLSGPVILRRSSPALLCAAMGRASSGRARKRMAKWRGERTKLGEESLCYQLRGIASFTNCLHRADKCGLGVGHDERAIRDRRIVDRAIFTPSVKREGMGEPAFPPQGVGRPVLFFAGLHFRRSRSAATNRAKTTEITPFMVKKAALRRERLSELT